MMEEHQVPQQAEAGDESIAAPTPEPASAPAPLPSPVVMDVIAGPDSAGPAPMPTILEPLSRPTSTSTQASAPQAPSSLQQLPGISSLQTSQSVDQQIASYQQQPISSTNPSYNPPHYARSSPASTAGPGGNPGLPTCQNCATSTTPLWRRDEMGSVLCNACGLFLKLHGRPRPISLKTDVIKSRNRVKTSRNDLAKQKKAPAFPPVSDLPGADNTGANIPAGASGLAGRRPSGRSANGHVDDNSPISRTGTPNMYNMVYPDMDGSQFQPQAGMAFAMSAADGRVATDLNGEHPPTQETILAENASLKTRVSELEVIQELYRGRLQQLESDETNVGHTVAQLREQLAGATQTETQLRNELEESHHRENMLKRRLDELELELKEAKGASETAENGRPAKKPRIEEPAAAAAAAAAAAEEASEPVAAAPQEAS
ncbi:GATA type zinc finger protein asd-4 [Coniochaeta hoffmannii]|uniref:GATA type zinc finger protein asd-4 n=1 Tax=Coniochaeta hoffmannii TaxID=91930 RepID=A0AA38S8B3_9PEZI|nr:GATA type zinc finger protein asd-4 [Coniochaeta hoffmannii]